MESHPVGLNCPVLYVDKKNCCGCAACYSICPVGAIAMVEDEEGFLYPSVNCDRCIKCFRCIKVCAFKSDQERKGYYQTKTEAGE